MKSYGKAAMSEIVEDHMMYRNLVPMDQRLQEFRAPGNAPRKHEPAYAQLVAGLLQQARALSSPGTRIERLLFVGDTHMSDAGAFNNLCLSGGWQGAAFIGSENGEPIKLERATTDGGFSLYLGNRWSLLSEFNQRLQVLGFPIDESTAVILDMDKTTLGARGRNAAVIDRARLQAVHQTVAALIGDQFDEEAFQKAYRHLGQASFHFFTADNQDYLAYICLILGSGLESLDELVRRLEARSLRTFEQFITEVDACSGKLPAGLADVHAEIYANVRQGDPTPFKPFRRNEYRATADLIGYMPDDTPAGDLLKDEIVMTAEVRHVAQVWKLLGALVFGLSDKPDEASVPTPELAAQGWKPLHRMQTHVVGE